jgi:hypothetical protein
MAMNNKIVEGGCTGPFRAQRLQSMKARLQGLERPIARKNRFWYMAAWPWRALRRMVRKARPGA